MRSTRSALALTLVGALALAACGGDDETEATVAAVSPTVNVGRTSDPLSQLLAEIYGQGMENAGVRVGRMADGKLVMANPIHFSNCMTLKKASFCS